jgi:anaerobic magnesium-protoporphyrin IX monomethyl ester cyclase
LYGFLLKIKNKLQNYDAIFIAPPFQHGNETMWKQFDYFFPPYGIAHIAAYIREFNYNSIILDCLVECPDLNDFDEYFKNNYVNKVDSIFFAITAVSPIIDYAVFIAGIVKKYFPKAIIVLGGPHATHEYKELIGNEDIDIIVVGEGEITFKEILDRKDLSEIKGIVYKGKSNNGKISIFVNPARPRIKNLDILPVPAYDLLNIKAYKAPKYSNQNIPSMSVVTGRGCVGNCTFCSKIFHEVYLMSPERVLEELTLLYEQYDIRQIIFYDDTFTINKVRVQKICNLIVEKKLDIRWTCFARVDCIDEDTLVHMKKAGCEHIMYGVENFDSEVLKNVHKNINEKQIFNAVNLTRKVGITCRVSLMIGNPGETKKTIWYNIKMINKLKPDYLQVLIFHPLPGAPIYNYFKENKLITAEKWSEFNFTKPIFIHENLSQKEIKKYYILMYVCFYLHPRFIGKQIKNIFIAKERKKLFWGLKAFMLFIIKNFLLLFKK